MKNRIPDFILAMLGGAGALVLAIAAIIDNEAADMASSIPPALLCCSMFIAGYVSFRNNGKK